MIEGHHYQNAYVPRDTDRWLETFRKVAKIDAEMVYEGTTQVRGAAVRDGSFFRRETMG